MAERIPGGIPVRQFLREYWQKKPLLIRAAVPDPGSLPGRSRLFALARSAGVESRLVLERHGDYPWQVVHGPISRGRLAGLPATHWSLLVQGVNFHDAASATLLDRFSFIPNWRVDDVMFSYAPDQGSVGPHVDSYDVFLLQTSGRRRWKISARRHGEDDLLPGLDLGILGNFRASREWELVPGDMLYLPPGVAHHGVAIGHSITCSVGFRAPSGDELLGALLDSQALPRHRYSDAGLRAQRHPGEITATQLRGLRALVGGTLPAGPALDRWLGRQLTQLPPGVPEPAPAPVWPVTRILERLARGATLHRAPAVRCAFVQAPRGRAWLYINGVEYAASATLAAAISGPGPVTLQRLGRRVTAADARLVRALLQAGALMLRG